MDHANTRVQQKEAFLNIVRFWFLEISFKKRKFPLNFPLKN